MGTLCGELVSCSLKLYVRYLLVIACVRNMFTNIPKALNKVEFMAFAFYVFSFCVRFSCGSLWC